MSTDKPEKCSCGHAKKQHVMYAGDRRNANGSRHVCTADGCTRWAYCDLNTTDVAKERLY